MLSEAKAQWLEEQRQEVEATVARVTQAAQEEADQRVEEATQQVKQVRYTDITLLLYSPGMSNHCPKKA